MKLKGAAQGTAPLVAEIAVAHVAEALGLPVPARHLVELSAETPRDDREDELGDLLDASVGLNLGFEWIESAREVDESDLKRLRSTIGARILWLDRFVLNVDRTRPNPNVLVRAERYWLIDHGASLPFHYDWEAVTEDSPGMAWAPRVSHLFHAESAGDGWTQCDAACAQLVSREILRAAFASVPDEFLAPLVPMGSARAIERRREAYSAFLWKRLKAPRAFAETSNPHPRPRA